MANLQFPIPKFGSVPVTDKPVRT